MTFSQPSSLRKKLFLSGKPTATGFLLCIFLSMMLMILDYYWPRLQKVRSGLSLAVIPIQYIVDYPVKVIGWGQSLIRSQKALADENMQLRYKQIMQEAQLQKFLVLKNENSQLKALLLTANKAQDHAMVAQILAVDTTSSRQIVILNKGSSNGVFTGQPVLDAKGVVGQIIDVGPLTSTLLLITDAKSAVPVVDHRTGERAILNGLNNSGKLSLINLPKTSMIKEGDLLMTSGLGRRYPEGYPVGIVSSVKNIAGEEFIKINVRPVSLLNHNRLVLLIWPEPEQMRLTAEIKERLQNLNNGAIG